MWWWATSYARPATDEEATAQARQRLSLMLAGLAGMGAPAEGELGSPSPLEAMGKILADHQFDEIIVATLPRRVSRWFGADLPHPGRRFGLPVTTIITGYAQLLEDAAHVGFDGAFGEVKPPGDGGVGLAFGNKGQDFALAWCEYGERIAAGGGGEQGGDDLGVERQRSSGSDSPDGVEEIVHAQDPVLEEVAEAARGDQRN